jgi:hypothetical protein
VLAVQRLQDVQRGFLRVELLFYLLGFVAHNLSING